MSQVSGSPSKKACLGLLAGMLLLGLAGVLVVTMPTPLLADSQAPARNLQAATVAPFVAPTVSPAVVAATTIPLALGATTTSAPVEQTVFKFGAASWGSSLSSVLLMTCFAFLYKKNTVDVVLKEKGDLKRKKIPKTDEDDFDNGICGCFDDMWVCIHGSCCPLVRMAHTNAVSGVMGFWATVITWLCCACITGGIGNCCMMVYWRKQLKGIMGIEDNLFCDVVVTCLVPGLSVCQSGTAVDRALGYEVVGCCDLEWNDDDDN